MRSRVGGAVLRWAAAAVLLLVAAALAWLRPLGADEAALSALDADRAGTGAVQVEETTTTLTLRPGGEPSGVGLVFQPGAKVDHRAYVRLLEPLAAAGHLVVVVQQPYFIGFAATGAPAGVIAAHPEVAHWVLGGHSLGGVAAGRYAAAHAPTADGQVEGLLLWASYPLGDLSGSGLQVASISAEQDALATPADIDASRADLPAGTTYVEVPGAVHAFFGDYGEQPGDGTPTVPREQAQAQVTAASLALLDSLADP